MRSVLDTAGRSGGVLVLGVGNILWADEGFGVRAVEAFADLFDVPDDVSVMDGGTQGLALVTDLAKANRILIFDAVDFGGKPGEMVEVYGDDVPRFAVGKKVSLHQTSMMELLNLSEVLADEKPTAIALIGCQPVDMEDYGGGLTDKVARQVAPAVQKAQSILESWGVKITPRVRPTGPDQVMPDAVSRQLYETGRPSAEDACRVGDDRVLFRTMEQASDLGADIEAVG